MKKHPIIFSGPMVRAILDGRKAMTRRVVKPSKARGLPDADSPVFSAEDGLWYCDGGMWMARCPYGVPGDRLWVRETWRVPANQAPNGIAYRADEPTPTDGFVWMSPIHMPRTASRITLEIMSVRVERLQEISEEDAKAEGLESYISGKWWQGYRRLEDGRLLHQQSRGDAPPEWMIEPHDMGDSSHLDHPAREKFRALWDSINGKRHPWESNPWTWVIEFRRAA